MGRPALDGEDWAVLAGLALVLWSVWSAFGLAAALACLGSVLIVVGLAAASRTPPRK